MRANSFNKRILATMAIALLCCFTAKAQDSKEWSIIPYTKIGYVLDGSVRLLDEVYHANAGVDAKVSFNEHWSLLAGVEYNTDGAFPKAVILFQTTIGKDYGISSAFLFAPSSRTNGFMSMQDFLWNARRTHAMMPTRLSTLV